MNKITIDVIGVKEIKLTRKTNEFYFQEISYQHLFKEEKEKIDNIFIITIGDQLFNDETKEELLNSIEVHFQLFTDGKLLHDFQNAELRHPEAIAYISSMTYEAQKILHESTTKLYDKSKFKNIALPIPNEADTLKVVKESLPKLDKSKMPIILAKEDWVASYIITMFSIINESTSKKDVIIEGNKIIIKEKEENEVFHFDEADVNALKSKIFVDFFQNPSVPKLILNLKDSELFRKCSHAAYYFETERNKVKNESLRSNFLELHEKFFVEG